MREREWEREKKFMILIIENNCKSYLNTIHYINTYCGLVILIEKNLYIVIYIYIDNYYYKNYITLLRLLSLLPSLLASLLSIRSPIV